MILSKSPPLSKPGSPGHAMQGLDQSPGHEPGPTGQMLLPALPSKTEALDTLLTIHLTMTTGLNSGHRLRWDMCPAVCHSPHPTELHPIYLHMLSSCLHLRPWIGRSLLRFSGRVPTFNGSISSFQRRPLTWLIIKVYTLHPQFQTL